jgi:hypothetical protein
MPYPHDTGRANRVGILGWIGRACYRHRFPTDESGPRPGGSTLFQRTVIARGGAVVQDLTQPACTHLGCTPG